MALEVAPTVTVMSQIEERTFYEKSFECLGGETDESSFVMCCPQMSVLLQQDMTVSIPFCILAVFAKRLT